MINCFFDDDDDDHNNNNNNNNNNDDDDDDGKTPLYNLGKVFLGLKISFTAIII